MTQAVAYTTYFELGEPVPKMGLQAPSNGLPAMVQKCLPVGLNSSKTVFMSLRSVTVIENRHQDANEHFKQMSILNKKSYIWRLTSTYRQCTQRNIR